MYSAQILPEVDSTLSPRLTSGAGLVAGAAIGTVGQLGQVEESIFTGCLRPRVSVAVQVDGWGEQPAWGAAKNCMSQLACKEHNAHWVAYG